MPLNLTDLIIESRTETPERYEFLVRTTIQRPVCCNVPASRNGTKRVKYRDLPMHGRHVTILVERQCYICPACGETAGHDIPGMSENNMMTQRLVDYIQKRALEATFTALGRELDMDEAVVRRIFRSWAHDELDKLKLETPEVMGIDEIHMMSGYRGVITDLKNRTLFDMLPNRHKPAIIKFLAGLPNKERVKVVAIDMWRPYKDAVELVLPNAIIVVDKFHIVRMANEAMERVRKEVRADLPWKRRLRLKNDRWILLANQETLSAHRRMIMEMWFDEFPKLKAAYEAKEGFRAIWTAKTSTEAKRRYEEWETSLDPEIEDAFINLRIAMRNWGKEIMAYFDERYTNAYTEAMNGIARIVNRAGRGYSFRVLRAKLMLASHRKE